MTQTTLRTQANSSSNGNSNGTGTGIRLRCVFEPPGEYVFGLEGLGRNTSTPDVLEANDAGFRQFVTGDKVRITVPDEERPYEHHLVLQVTSRNCPELPIRRHLRVMIWDLSSSENDKSGGATYELFPKLSDVDHSAGRSGAGYPRSLSF